MNMELWRPSRARAEETLLAQFMESLGVGVGQDSLDYDILWDFSIHDPETFWSKVWDFCDVIGERGGTVLERKKDLLAARFFPDAKLNYAENLLRRSGSDPAIIFHGESGIRREFSWDDLRHLVSRLQQALRALGVGLGDRVAGFLPNIPETVAAMLATTSLGAVWSSCSPDFGGSGLLDRFGQIEPKVLFCADGYFYNNKKFSSLTTVGKLGKLLGCLQSIIVVPYVQEAPDISSVGEKGVLLDGFLSPFEERDIEFTRVGFRDPLFIMFSSGTTDLPKCIVHSVGGGLIQHMKEHQLQCDVKPGDRLMYFTTCGWMMWNWQVSALASGATIVLFDGSPFYPDGNRLADIAATERITHFGTSAKYLDACAKGSVAPAKTHDMSSLRTILSTGSPLAPEMFDYVYRDWKKDVCLSSISGGTDILACFVGGNPVGPVYRGQCQKRHLGMDVHVFDENGNPVEGRQGELVCLSAHPSMPTEFWNDPGGARYRNAYFERFDNVWCQGDWVELTPEGGMLFYGRSDATLNPGGVRIGTAEIYRQVKRIDEVLESLVIGQEWKNDVRVILFVRLRDGVDLADGLIKRIKTEIRTNTSPRHVPAKVIAIADIPHTKSGKIVELAVRDVVHGWPVRNLHSLANPEALEQFKNIPTIQN
jgi:acetoacetyl-CoA synthetase